MTRNVRHTVPGHAQTHTHTQTHTYPPSIWFLFPLSQSSITTVLHSIQDDKMKTGYTSIFCRFEIFRCNTCGFACVCGCVCVPNPEGRRIICCNCSSAGALLTDRYPRYGCWTEQYQYFPSMYWQLSGSSLKTQLSVETPDGLQELDMSYLCVSRRFSSIPSSTICQD